jgi:hypothetical protein
MPRPQVQCVNIAFFLDSSLIRPRRPTTLPLRFDPTYRRYIFLNIQEFMNDGVGKNYRVA